MSPSKYLHWNNCGDILATSLSGRFKLNTDFSRGCRGKSLQKTSGYTSAARKILTCWTCNLPAPADLPTLFQKRWLPSLVAGLQASLVFNPIERRTRCSTKAVPHYPQHLASALPHRRSILQPTGIAYCEAHELVRIAESPSPAITPACHLATSRLHKSLF